MELSRESSSQAHNRYGVQNDSFLYIWVNGRRGKGNSFPNLPFTFLTGLVHQGHAEAASREAPPRLPAQIVSSKKDSQSLQAGAELSRGKKAPPPAVG